MWRKLQVSGAIEAAIANREEITHQVEELPAAGVLVDERGVEIILRNRAKVKLGRIEWTTGRNSDASIERYGA